MRGLLLLVLGLSAARPALACGMCVDQEIRVWLPFAGPVMILCLLWAASVLVARRVLARRGADVPRDASPFGAARRFLLVGMPAYIALAILLAGSILGPGLLIGGVWVVVTVISTARLRRGRRRRGGAEVADGPEPGPTARMKRLIAWPVLAPGAARAALTLNVVFLALAAVAVPVSYVHARSTARMIALLSYPSSGTGSVLLPGLVAKGQSAVPALINASRRALDGKSGFGKGSLVRGTLHCLGRIGGADAEAFLEEVVRERVDFADYMDADWQKAACLAYAECAGARAVPLLMEVHKRSEGAAVRDAGEAVLKALKKAGGGEGAASTRDGEATVRSVKDAKDGKGDSKEAVVPPPVRLVSWNIQYGRDGGDSSNGWPGRKGALAAALGQETPDVLCVQEALAGQLEFLAEVMPRHERLGVGRDDGVAAGEHCAILFDPGRFRAAESGTFWLSDTPEVPGRTWANRCTRICTWARLEQAGGGAFLVMNTHFPLDEESRVKSAALVVGRLGAIAREGEPVALAGDFNCSPGSPPWSAIEAAGLAASEEAAGGTASTPTFHRKGIPLVRIDAVFVRGMRVREHHVIVSSTGGAYPSDHFGVLAVVELPDAGRDE